MRFREVGPLALPTRASCEIPDIVKRKRGRRFIHLAQQREARIHFRLLLSNRREEGDSCACDQQHYSSYNSSVVWQFTNFIVRDHDRRAGLQKQSAVSDHAADGSNNDSESDQDGFQQNL